jgi:hypothetical protein
LLYGIWSGGYWQLVLGETEAIHKTIDPFDISCQKGIYGLQFQDSSDKQFRQLVPPTTGARQ